MVGKEGELRKKVEIKTSRGSEMDGGRLGNLTRMVMYVRS